jgi:hypothetical protein
MLAGCVGDLVQVAVEIGRLVVDHAMRAAADHHIGVAAADHLDRLADWPGCQASPAAPTAAA